MTHIIEGDAGLAARQLRRGGSYTLSLIEDVIEVLEQKWLLDEHDLDTLSAYTINAYLNEVDFIRLFVRLLVDDFADDTQFLVDTNAPGTDRHRLKAVCGDASGGVSGGAYGAG